MAADRDIAFLLDQARLRGTKVVMVGDDRQLGAVSVGGAMGALVERHGGIVHALDQNVRQHNEAEREALAELRAGDVTRAVEFYLDHGPGDNRANPGRGAGHTGRPVGEGRARRPGRRHVRLEAGQRGRAQPPGQGADGGRGTGHRARAGGSRGYPLCGR